ncbi:MAG: sulfite exporter TauE/SafE family protein [Intestinibacter sp.]
MLDIKHIVFFLIVLAANIVQSITGFAGNLLAMPASILLIGIDQSSAVLNILTMFNCTLVISKSYKYINYRELKKIVVYMLIGVVVGIYLKSILPLNITLNIYALFIIFIAVKNLLKRDDKDKDENLNNILSVVILLISGIIQGVFVSGGALLVVYAVNALNDKDEFRATVATVWIILGFFLGFSHYKSGFYTMETIKSIIIGFIPVGLAVFIGNHLHEKIEKNTFLILVYILLVVSGVILLVK